MPEFIALFRRAAVRWADREECEVRRRDGWRCTRVGTKIIPQPPLPSGMPQYGRLVCNHHHTRYLKEVPHG